MEGRGGKREDEEVNLMELEERGRRTGVEEVNGSISRWDLFLGLTARQKDYCHGWATRIRRRRHGPDWV
jgi:hypothetical protein